MNRMHRFGFGVVGVMGVVCFVCLGGCSSLPGADERVNSYGLTGTELTPLGVKLEEGLGKHPGMSGLCLLEDDYESLEMRLLLADAATRSLDIQTFIWKSDTSGRLLIKRLLEAADRGVRVRVLLDDFGIKDADFSLAAFDSHANVQIRIFNPFGVRLELTRGLEMVADMDRLNHRMHNKLYIADNQFGIVGGRNVGDEYFDLHSKYNYVDLDALVAGPVAGDVSDSFDAYWNSDWAVPIGEIKKGPGGLAVEGLRKRLDEWVDEREEELDLPPARHSELNRMIGNFYWVDAEIVFEDPAKSRGSTKERGGLNVGPALAELGLRSQKEILIASPYIVVGEQASAALEEARGRGVGIHILTNSMAATDNMPAFSGFSKSRRELLEAGVELYEIKPGVEGQVNEATEEVAGLEVGLHAKVAVFDRAVVYIGSFNFDPRSANINTEVGLIVNDAEFATEVAEFIEELSEPRNSWRSFLDEKGRLVWEGVDGGKVRRYRSDPYAPLERQILSFLFSLLPIEEQL